MAHFCSGGQEFVACQRRFVIAFNPLKNFALVFQNERRGRASYGKHFPFVCFWVFFDLSGVDKK
jgi:hypothetical protein